MANDIFLYGLIHSIISLSLFGRLAFADSENEAFACLLSHHSDDRETQLTCASDEGIEIDKLFVGQSSSYDCSADHCDLDEITNINNAYHIYLTNICHHHVSCPLSSTILNNISNYDIFPNCGPAHQVRNTVIVTYHCVDVGATPSTWPTTTHFVSSTSSATTQRIKSPLPSTVTVGVWPTLEAQIEEQVNGQVENLTVKIVAPILAFLTLVSLVVLIACLRAKKFGPPTRIREKPNNEQTTHYEDVAESYPVPDEEETYYSEAGQNVFTNPQMRSPSVQLDLENQNDVSTHQQDRPNTRNKPPDVQLQVNETLTDDGFYDTLSDDNIYSIAEPVVSDTYAEIRGRTIQAFTSSDDQQSNDNDYENNHMTGHPSTNETAEHPQASIVIKPFCSCNDLYSVAEPVLKESSLETSDEPVLIKNDLYEQMEMVFAGAVK